MEFETAATDAKIICERYQKLLPETLLERLVAQATEKSVNREVFKDSWVEEIDGACGLFDISGFSRLASKLTKAETKKRKNSDVANRRNSKRSSIIMFENTEKNELLKNASKMLVEETDARGKGSEELASFISSFFEDLVDTISASGGDIIKFAGDCLICIWEKKDGRSMGQTVYNAIRCGYALKDKVTNLDDSSSLSLHISVGAGKIKLVSLSSSNRAEYFVLGNGYVEALGGIDASNSGEIVLSKSGVEYLKHAIDEEKPVNEATHNSSDRGGILDTKMETRELENQDHRLLVHLDDNIFPAAKLSPKCALPHSAMKLANLYVPRNVRKLISDNEEKSVLHDVAVVFINFRGVEKMDLGQLDHLFQAIASSVNSARASLKEFVVDDKGAVAVVVVGFPGEGHASALRDNSNAARALSVALLIRKKVALQGVFVGTGIASGKAYCGMVGSKNRCNYAAVGSIVNLSARFMGKDMRQGGHIIVSEDITMDRYVRTKYRFAPIAPMALKGFEHVVSTYVPTGRIDRSPNIMNPYSTAFISREETLKKLHDAATRNGTTLLVKCEKGVGGTTCLAELVSQLENDNILVCMSSGIPKSSQYYMNFGAIAPVLLTLLSVEELKEKREMNEAKNVEADFATSKTLVRRHALAVIKRSERRLTRGKSFNGGITADISQALDTLYSVFPFLNHCESSADDMSNGKFSKYVHDGGRDDSGGAPFLMYSTAENVRVANAVKKIVEWKTQRVEDGVFYDRIVVILDDLDLFDYGSLAVLDTLMSSALSQFSIIGCVQGIKVKEAGTLPVRRQSIQMKRHISFERKIEEQKKRLTKTTKLGYYNTWTRDEETRKRLMNVVGKANEKILLQRFSMEAIKTLVMNKYGKDCNIDESVFEKLYNLGGTLPAAALDLIESWIDTGVLVWKVKSVSSGEFISASNKCQSGDKNNILRKKRGGRRGSTIPKSRNRHTDQIQAILQWSSEDSSDRSLDLPAQIAQYYAAVLEDFKPVERRMLELISCFPGDVLLRYIELYDLFHGDLVSRTLRGKSMKRTMSMRRKTSSTSSRQMDVGRGVANIGQQKRRTQSQNNSEMINEVLHELVSNGILSSSIGKYGHYYRFSRTGMRRTTYESMLFSTRKNTHYKVLQVFKTLKNEKNALHIALFHAEKAGLYSDLVACLWNQGVSYLNDKHPDYASAFVSFEQALTVLVENDVDIQNITKADFNNMYSPVYDHITTGNGRKTLGLSSLMVKLELHKRLATICMHRGDINSAREHLSALSRMHKSSFVKTLVNRSSKFGACGLLCIRNKAGSSDNMLADNVKKWEEYLVWAKEHCRSRTNTNRSLGEKFLHINIHFQHHIHTDETSVVAKEMTALCSSVHAHQ